MTPLQMFWTVLLVVSLFLFFLVEIVVTIGGAFNLRDLFRTLARRVGHPTKMAAANRRMARDKEHAYGHI